MPKQPANIHEAFFKSIMSEPECAGQFLREHLPPEIAALLSDDPPELQSGSFVDEALAQYQTDLLFRIKLKEGGETLAYILAEHKSSPDPLARLQLPALRDTRPGAMAPRKQATPFTCRGALTRPSRTFGMVLFHRLRGPVRQRR